MTIFLACMIVVVVGKSYHINKLFAMFAIIKMVRNIPPIVRIFISEVQFWT